MGRSRFPFIKLLFTLTILLIGAYFTRAYWLPAVVYPLIHDEGPARADIVVVLAGDYTGNRILRGAQLVREGFAPVALISSPVGFYGADEAAYSIPFAVRKGYRPEGLIPFPNNALSTRDEARMIVPELRRRGVRTALLVTSDYHTARAARLFRAAARGTGIQIRVAAAPDRYFHANTWWLNRESQKTVLQEWAKTFATAIGI